VLRVRGGGRLVSEVDQKRLVSCDIDYLHGIVILVPYL